MAYRRPNPAADKAAANQAVIKSLLKLPGNKVCADCKRNKLPRWASWNLGIFICIRCSGIHRGMGTHISRVKSVDLDSWTDEQLASMVKWGNTRANKYWEANLAPGHVPAEGKIENFVRTKYESKRWVLSKDIPDPATLGDEEGDDELPLKVVQKKLEQQPQPAAPQKPLSPPRPSRSAPPVEVDLIGGGDPAPSRAVQQVAAPVERPSSAAAAPRPQATASSELFGEFFGSPASTPTTHPTTTTTSSRPDLNRSILSLYASAPKPAPPQQQPQQQQQQTSAFGDLAGDFAGLSFTATPQATTAQSPTLAYAQPPKPSPFDSLAASAYSSARASASKPLASTSTSGFFSSAYTGKPPQSKPAGSQPSLLSSATTTSAFSKPATTSSGFDDLLGLAAPAPSNPPKPATQTSTASAFNLNAWSTPASSSIPTNTASSIPTLTSTTTATPANIDPWADFSSNPAPTATTTTTSSLYSSQPKPVATVARDDDWGSFASAVGPTSPATTTGGAAKPAVPPGGLGNKALEDDLFGNVWG